MFDFRQKEVEVSFRKFLFNSAPVLGEIAYLIDGTVLAVPVADRVYAAVPPCADSQCAFVSFAPDSPGPTVIAV